MGVIYKPNGRALEFAPLAFNPYRGCSHACKYCFAPAVLLIKREKFNTNPQPRDEILKKFRKDLLKMEDHKTPITFSFSCDPYQALEEKYKITRRCIEMCIAQEQPVNILTKSSLVARDFDVIGQDTRNSIGMTLTFVDPDKSMEWEPGASLPNERFETLKAAHALGIKTWASIEPVIDPVESLKIIQQTLGYVDHYKVGSLNYNKLANAVDWIKFRAQAIGLLGSKSYYLTESLTERCLKCQQSQ